VHRAGPSAARKRCFILDHGGKPAIGCEAADAWKGHIARLAAEPNLHCKLSGLGTEAPGGRWSVGDLQPYADHLLSCFGAGRVLFGSDWPVVKLAGGLPLFGLRARGNYVSHLDRRTRSAPIFRENARQRRTASGDHHPAMFRLDKKNFPCDRRRFRHRPGDRRAFLPPGRVHVGRGLPTADSAAGQETVEIDPLGGRPRRVRRTRCQATPSAALALGGRIPPVDVLVNNAGIGHVGNLAGTGTSDLDRLYAVNVRGPFNLCKAFVPSMLGRGSGSVINMASIGGIVAVRDRLAYTVTKFAVVGLTKSLALDHSHTGVRFNAICPGRVETPFVKSRIAEYPDPAKAYREMSATQLTGRMARPDEIAAAALYLASDASAMVTGSSLMIDGGWSAGK
jgi:2-keto-3-deoxy-L-fuconate dehydrogenase